jgi:hypothetical protein
MVDEIVTDETASADWEERATGHADTIRQAMKRMNVNAATIGGELTKAHTIIPYGRWFAWLRDNFEWSPRTATTFMRVHDMAVSLGSETFSDLPIQQSALYLMARSTTPESVRAELIAMAKAGTKVSHAIAKEHIRETFAQKVASARIQANVARGGPVVLPDDAAAKPSAPAPLFNEPEYEIDDDRLDVYERARDALNELKGALPPSATNDPDEEMFDAIVALENRIKDAYWEVVTGEAPTDTSVGLPAPMERPAP